MDKVSSIFDKLIINDLMGEEKKTMTTEEFFKFTIDCYNESEGNLDKQDGIQCKLCKNKGNTQVITGKFYSSYVPCKCMRMRYAVNKAKNSGLGGYLHKTLSDYKVEADWQKVCKKATDDYLTKHSEDNTWFMVCGQSGCGKTLLGSIIANKLLFDQDREVMYVIWTDFIGEVKRSMMSDKADAVTDRMIDIKNVDVLFLDEVLKKYNDTDLRYLIEIINYRYTNDKKTIITSEKLMNELIDIEEATFGRAVEKCAGFVINIPKDRKKNYRLRSITV